ncbi:TetR family transcriptional regulator [Herbihabitans rhizosphaerae]|uniref:TetR family transcriptional regulator n=1 Tax=Herbihabitans rhizosphaerae TaxID=1872711 RepID=A0A4V2ER78_9PSEU|nr:TetR/AcrR family transcriptional regulator C-terminal domain-containing protein [Herbihabitans rhizosphaerae]RZS29481.1 TetR family transcriptional regulator [Herbihabitans rhizosphaerae]
MTDDGTNSGELLWDLDEGPARKARPTLTVDRIAKAATTIADADGLTAVSMQNVATKLDVTKMALYRHVASKAELVAVMTETAVGTPPNLKEIRGGWRPKLELWAQEMRRTWQRHPWIPAATAGSRVTGPREIGWTEVAVGALEGTGLDGAERMDAVFLLSGHIRNTQSPTTAGTQPWSLDRTLNPMISARPERFPSLVAAAASVGNAPKDNGWEFGLIRILDGIAKLIATRRRTKA